MSIETLRDQTLISSLGVYAKVNGMGFIETHTVK
jgi:hypothetical protein